ncbi:Sphingolipid delta(4)-desaturase DES1 [Pseudolycoriella hygida]|uniref:sphingolipid 4-desaturase n=1 Tax=Pseudolycoriella hygida TaxID=35572 RepID=A0A9Q0ML51_9DIPT|nr:Sphingolipid delta(4)-desaturase DES1 [Pseudolycoriella hygida]
MGQTVTREDFEWTTTDEPHASRRKIILAKCPQIKQLYGHDPIFKYVCTALVLTQFVMLFVMKGQSWPITILVAYCFGGVLNHSLLLALHEIAHNQAFGHVRPLHNRLFGLFCNLPVGIPASISFKIYHLEHHRYQGIDGVDVDIPSQLEVKLFRNTFGKFCWVCLQPFFYALRPIFVNPKPMTRLQLINIVIQMTFNAAVVHFFGWRVLWYLILSSLLSTGLHPLAGHFISEHYLFAKGFETYSYYGPLNLLTFNVGYHNEHHDFPAVAGRRLPEVKRIAAEFYDNLPQHTSWCRVIYDFIMDPAIGPYARCKRKQKGLQS